MRIIPTTVAGAFLINDNIHSDVRGTFQCLFRKSEFQANGLRCDFVEQGKSTNPHEGTLRGLHYQVRPCGQVKFVRCTRGAVIDILVDLRPESPTYLSHALVYLTHSNGARLYVPEGVAHGYQTLIDNTDVEYLMTKQHCAEHSAGVRWNDPLFNIHLARPVRCIHPRDAGYEDYRPIHG